MSDDLNLSKDEFVEALPALTIEELQAVQKGIESELKSRDKIRTKEARKAIQETLKAHGFSSVEEVFLPTEPTRTYNKAPIKYQNYENPEQTWTGRGKKPNWLVSALNQGAQLSQFSVQGA